jgi:streptomycin 3"-adenylyltransferase
MAEVDAYLRELKARLIQILSDDLVGVYLHGSAAMGAFVPSRSDIDVLAVTKGRLSVPTKAAVADALSEASLPCPGVGLEMSIVTVDSVRTPSDAPAFELHVATLGSRVVDGADHPGDPDLLAHFAMTRARGVCLYGPEPQDAFIPVDRARLLRSLADDLTWALDHRLSGMGPYAVLNACRGLRLARTGEFCSKPEGGTWALETRVGDPALIAAALRRQEGADEEVDGEAAASFVVGVRAELLRHAGSCAS